LVDLAGVASFDPFLGFGKTNGQMKSVRQKKKKKKKKGELHSL
jgi:hypothetical protein